MRKPSTLIIIAIVVILAIVAVFIKTSGTHHFMDKTITTPDAATKAFMEMMIPHHQEAVRTSMQIAEDKTAENVDLKILSGRIIDNQTFEIIQMLNWYEEWFGMEFDLSGVSHTKKYVPMMSAVASTTGTVLEKGYVEGMIKHHKMAVEMAEELLAFFDKADKERSSTDGELTVRESHPNVETMRDFAKKIIEVQNKEIQQLSSLKLSK